VTSHFQKIKQLIISVPAGLSFTRGLNLFYIFGEKGAEFVSEFCADNVLFPILNRLQEDFIFDKSRADSAQNF
jgi:hypothetical protein